MKISLTTFSGLFNAKVVLLGSLSGSLRMRCKRTVYMPHIISSHDNQLFCLLLEFYFCMIHHISIKRKIVALILYRVTIGYFENFVV